MKNYLSVVETAKRLGITRQAVLKRINKKQLEAVKIGRAYIVRYQE